MFGLYLDIQKHKTLEELPEPELRGRWKSFVNKWNRGELAEGWYDPATLQKAQASAAQDGDLDEPPRRRASPTYSPLASDDSSDEELGPSLPNQKAPTSERRKKVGPGVPSLQDLELRRELQEEAALAELNNIRHERRLDRVVQKERLDDLAPLADPGTKARLLEKKREKADSNRAFACAKTDAAGAMQEVPDADLLGDGDGDGDGGMEGYKRQKREMERKKNEREVRREEILAARREEREERVREYKAREERTMSGLVALARQRFG
ncbi:hypothetical protein ACLMJK_003195 [Lecanora helva]